MKSNRTRYTGLPTISGMGRKEQSIKDVLWGNVAALMKQHYGKENLNRFARETGIGPGGASRIKEAKTSVGLDVLEKIAKRFHLPVHALLAPGMQSSVAAELPPREEMMLTVFRGLTPEQQRELVVGTLAQVEANRQIQQRFLNTPLRTFSNEEVHAAFGDIPPLRKRRGTAKGAPRREQGDAMGDFLDE